MKVKKFIQQLSINNLEDFFTLFSNDTCEKCQCTFYFSANNMDSWARMSIAEVKKLREDITSKCHDGYIYYIDNEPVAWCQCVYPQDVPYLQKLLNIEKSENTKIISCFFIKKEYRGKGIQKELLQNVLVQCKNEGIDLIYSIPVFDDFLKTVDEKRKNEKLHTGHKKLFEQFNFICIGNNGRYYFMKKDLTI